MSRSIGLALAAGNKQWIIVATIFSSDKVFIYFRQQKSLLSDPDSYVEKLHLWPAKFFRVLDFFQWIHLLQIKPPDHVYNYLQLLCSLQNLYNKATWWLSTSNPAMAVLQYYLVVSVCMKALSVAAYIWRDNTKEIITLSIPGQIENICLKIIYFSVFQNISEDKIVNRVCWDLGRSRSSFWHLQTSWYQQSSGRSEFLRHQEAVRHWEGHYTDVHVS